MVKWSECEQWKSNSETQNPGGGTGMQWQRGETSDSTDSTSVYCKELFKHNRMGHLMVFLGCAVAEV